MGRKPTDTNEQQSTRKRLHYECRKLDESPKLKGEYDDIVNKQFSACVVEEAHRNPSGDRVCYMPHKPIVRQNPITTKVRMAFDASAKPNATHHLTASTIVCMYAGPALQPYICSILVLTRLLQNIGVADIPKAFLQVEVREEDRCSFRFL